MSILLMSRVWLLDLSHQQQAVLLCLADFANDEGEDCFPSLERIVWKTGYGIRTVQRTVKEMEDTELIEVERVGGRGKVNRYKLVLDNGRLKPPFVPNIKGVKIAPKETEPVGYSSDDHFVHPSDAYVAAGYESLGDTHDALGDTQTVVGVAGDAPLPINHQLTTMEPPTREDQPEWIRTLIEMDERLEGRIPRMIAWKTDKRFTDAEAEMTASGMASVLSQEPNGTWVRIEVNGTKTKRRVYKDLWRVFINWSLRDLERRQRPLVNGYRREVPQRSEARRDPKDFEGRQW